MSCKSLATRYCSALLLLLCLPGLGSAQDSDELFGDGNRLFRDDLYWAALLRYEQAAAAGLDSPLLQYNVGVAHYRARQYGRARAAFERALQDGALQYAATYNLGLTAVAAGDKAGALPLFRQVEQQQQSRRLSELATRAIDELLADDENAEIDEQSLDLNDPAVRPEGLQLRVSVGVGSDDNVYRSPDQPYTDQAQAGNPQVTPVVRSGAYYPIDFNARYSVGSFENESFFASYRVMTRYLQDPELEDAGELTQQLAFGSTFHSKSENRERKIHSAFTVAQHSETWFDPDDGTERRDNGELLGDRLSYVRYGPELWARQSFKRLSFNVAAKGQIWNYDKAGEAQEYDHEYLQF
ncbi:MAG: tetratricopeptide repeat protein, partial [Woeseia sp.]